MKINFRQIIKPVIIFIGIIMCHLPGWTQYRVMATVIDEEGRPEEYATFRIFELPDTTRQIIGNITQSDGVINSPLPNSGEYKIVISAMMKLPITIDFTIDDQLPVADLGIISTELAGETLDEVTVTATRPLVTKEIDRIGYDVQADGEASTSNLREILKKVPLVSVDDEGNIKVNGSDNFKIYRNGRPNNAFTKNAKDIFAAIPASTIKKIEVITDPGAREDAESSGVILNIVTTSTLSMSGVTGNLGLYYQSNFGPQANAFIMTQIKKLTFSASGGYYKYFKSKMRGTQDSHMEFDSTGDILDTYSTYQAGGSGGWFNVDGSLELDTLNLVTTSLNGYIGKNSNDFQSKATMLNFQGETLYSYDFNSYYRKYGYTDIDFSLDYQRSTKLKGESITLSYRLSHTRQDQDKTVDYYFIQGNPFPYTYNLSDFDLKFFEHTFQLDWNRPLGNHFNLDTGGKYILRTSHSINHQDLGEIGQTKDDFKHTYDIFGVYADARATWGNFSARMGLRYEYSRLQADFLTGNQEDFHTNLNDVVPNASIAWNASDASMWKLSYNRRIQRPGISYLNPAIEVSPNDISFGNPDLKSSTYDNLLLNFSFIKNKFNLDLTLSLKTSNNGMGEIKWTNENITYNTYGNTLKDRMASFSIYFLWQITDKTSWMVNGELEWERYSLREGTDKIKNARLTGYYYTRIQQKLPWDLTLTLSSNYFSGWINGLYSYVKNPAQNISYSIGIRRSFFNHKLDVSVSAANLGIHSRITHSYAINGGRTGYNFSTQHPRQQVTVGLTWSFGNLQAQVKKTEKSISNDDLQGRKNN